MDLSPEQTPETFGLDPSSENLLSCRMIGICNAVMSLRISITELDLTPSESIFTELFEEFICTHLCFCVTTTDQTCFITLKLAANSHTIT